MPIGERRGIGRYEAFLRGLRDGGLSCRIGCQEIPAAAGKILHPVFASFGSRRQLRILGADGHAWYRRDPARERKTMESSDKAALRAKYLAVRRALTDPECSRRSASVMDRLWSVLEFRAADTVLSYVSSKDHEVDTRCAIERMIEEGRRVAVPAVAAHGRLAWRRLSSLSDLEPGRFGILEPMPSCESVLDLGEESVALIPGIVFTPRGDRIGYGGGYFDRFLAGFHGTSIGLSFDFQVVETFEPDTHDRRLDLVVCESAVYRRSQGAGR